ncbi:MAG: CapA family protein [Bacteroidota bacterium]
MLYRSLKITLISLIIFFSCKTSKNLTQSTTQNVSDTVPSVDSLIQNIDFYITQKGDTLYELGKEFKIEVFPYDQDTFSFIAVGDIMTGTNFPSTQYLPPNNAFELWDEVKDTLRNADVTFGNLEGVILNEGGTRKYCKDTTICYLFRMPEILASNFTDSGFDLLSTANNHAGDFGDEGRTNTMNALDSLGIEHAGLLQKPFAEIKKPGIRVGFAAFSPNTGTHSINDYEKAVELVSGLDSLNDVVIVSFHGGAEGSKYEHVNRKREIFYGENRGNVYEFAHTMIDAGADLIFGHGPHVTRTLELYKDRLISYSLGNFLTYGRFNLRGVNGIAPILKVYTDKEGKFLHGVIIPIKQIGRGEPVIDPDKRVIFKLQDLMKEDFPETPLIISDEGLVRKTTDQ